MLSGLVSQRYCGDADGSEFCFNANNIVTTIDWASVVGGALALGLATALALTRALALARV